MSPQQNRLRIASHRRDKRYYCMITQEYCDSSSNGLQTMCVMASLSPLPHTFCVCTNRFEGGEENILNILSNASQHTHTSAHSPISSHGEYIYIYLKRDNARGD